VSLAVAMVFVSKIDAAAQSDNPVVRSTTAPPNPQAASAFKVKRQDVADDDLSSPGFTGHISDFLRDQKAIWTSPTRIRSADAAWIVPVAGITAGLLASDRQYSASLSRNPVTLRHYNSVSNLGLVGLIGGSAGLYFASFPKHNEHWRETGFLAGEAALNSLVTVEVLKYSLGRQRPNQGIGSGSFFQRGTSFPSEHAAAAWSVAGVIAHEYDGPLPKLFAYGMASAVSFSRIRARQHFPSDVLVGGLLGYFISQSIYTRHHDAELGGTSFKSPREVSDDERTRNPSFMGSPYVPLDSWIYSALERLAALGYVKTASLGIRPWTRLECARLLSEAGDYVGNEGAPEAQELYQSLSEEFTTEFELETGERNLHFELESVYQRSLGISGRPLTDGYHIGQTVVNDYGRPFQQGFNTVAGTSSWASMGPFVIYARGEYQYAPSAPAPSQAVLDFISGVDYLPVNAPSVPVAETNRFRLLDAYVGMNVANWQLSYGKQSLWWGPSDGGTMALTNNAEPLNSMFRLNRVSPFRLPDSFGLLGDIRLDFFIGQVSGQEFINNTGNCCSGTLAQGSYGVNLKRQPFLSGGRVSFRFTENLEFSMSKTVLYGGPGNPLTPKTFLQSNLSLHADGTTVGDGRAVVDFSYRLPRLRDWLTVYGEGFSEDEVFPPLYPQKSAWQGGLYLAKVPRLNKLDFRVEGGSTSPADFSTCNGCFYHNFQYVNGFTNNGQLMGTWIGRASQGELLRSTYWLSPTKKIGIEMRHRAIDRTFLLQGGTQDDIAVNSDFVLKSGFRVSGMLQYERWQIPLLAAGAQSDVTAGFQVAYSPKIHHR